jgi:beta-glucosidase
VCSGVSVPAQQAHNPFSDPNLPAEKRIDDLLSLMTPEEKIASLGRRDAVPWLGVPNMGISEGIHGVVQRDGRGSRQPVTTAQFPQPPGMGTTRDPDLVRQARRRRRLRSTLHHTDPQVWPTTLLPLGSQSDLARDPRWGRSNEVYGEAPFFNGTTARAFAKGLQGGDPKYWQGAALLKHFPADSNEDVVGKRIGAPRETLKRNCKWRKSWRALCTSRMAACSAVSP